MQAYHAVAVALKQHNTARSISKDDLRKLDPSTTEPHRILMENLAECGVEADLLQSQTDSMAFPTSSLQGGHFN